MRKGFTTVEILIVIFVLLMLVALILPAVIAAKNASEMKWQQQQTVTVVIEEKGLGAGDFAYLMLDGTKVQILSIRNDGLFWARHADKEGRLSEIAFFPFELADEMPKMEVKDDIR